eukprot:scaffold640864_cov51-Prasinocladus_malaysianus.AAC.1
MALEVDQDIAERPTWGFDSHTHRNLVQALGMCPGYQSGGGPEDLSRRQLFVERRLLPAIQRAGGE